MEEDWRSKEREDIDLRLENLSLEADMRLKGGMSFKNADVEPETENAFLKKIAAYEEADDGPPVPVRSLFPEDFEFPPASSLPPEKLAEKIQEIARVLSANNIEFGFANDLPDEVLYRYLAEDFAPNELISAAAGAGFTWCIDGCDGGCDDCFQKAYCSTAKEILGEDGLSTDA
jgi:hypothetical protein